MAEFTFYFLIYIKYYISLHFNKAELFHQILVFIIWFPCFMCCDNYFTCLIDVFLNYFWVYKFNMAKYTLYFFSLTMNFDVFLQVWYAYESMVKTRR